MGKVFLEDLLRSGGGEVESYFAILEIQSATSSRGEAYRVVLLSDVTGRAKAYAFDDMVPRVDAFQRGDVVQVRLEIQNQGRNPLLRIRSIEAYPFFQYRDLVPFTPHNLSELESAFFAYMREVKTPPLRKLLLSLFEEDRDVWDAFRMAPAAMKMHHAYVGGLLEHTVSLVRLARAYASEDPRIRGDLLVTGAFLHDIGKMDELIFFPELGYTDEGRLLGHIYLGARRVDRHIQQLRERGVDFPETLRLELLHMILAHHGLQEWGSPVEPRTFEAHVLHYLDNLDAKAWMYRNALDHESEDRWIYQEGLRRPVFRGIRREPYPNLEVNDES